MRVDATISEPFLLSSYGISQRFAKSGPANISKKQKSLPNLFATHGKASGSSDGYATMTAQADGVHILDVSTLHPVISHTLGPSTTFTCPAVTINTNEGADRVCTTYAAIETASELSVDEYGKTIWVWSENMSSSLVDRASQKKKSILIPHLIAGLYSCEELPSRLLAQSPNGDVTVINVDINDIQTRSSPYPGHDIHQTFIYPRKPCTFVPSRVTPSRGAVIVTVMGTDDLANIEILSINHDDGQFIELGNCPVPLKQTEILAISCSTMGYLSIISRDGSWHSFQLESTDGETIKLSPATETFCLKGLSFISKSSNSNEDVSLLSLNSSLVLLAAFSKSSAPEIILLLWDLQYSVLLASNSLPIPSSLTQSKDVTINLTLVAASGSQSLLLLSPNPSITGRKSQTGTSRSSVLVVPFTAPATSTIANAMGRGSAGAKWTEQTSSSSTFLSPPPHDPVQSKILATMQRAMEQNLPQAANVAFFEWEKREKAAAKSRDEKESESPTLGYSFVKDLFVTVLQPSKPPNTPYSSEVPRYLLNRQVVSGNMIDGGLLRALRVKGDWQTIDLALKNVLDLSETEVVESLKMVIAHHRQKNAADAMQIDSTGDFPALSAFLSSCISYPSTPATLRLAIRQLLKDAEDVLAIVKVLGEWISKWGHREIKLLPSQKDITKNEYGVTVLKNKEKEIHRDLPPLPKVLAFLQTLLDASFLLLLQHPPSHPVLRGIFSHIETEFNFLDQMEQLRGPLEPFAKAQTKAIKEAEGDKRKQPLVDWRQRRKQAHEQAGLSIGLYQLEELVL